MPAGRLSWLQDRLILRTAQGGRWQPVRAPQFAIRTVRILAVPLLMAGVAPATVAAAQTRSPDPAAAFTVTGQLFGVAATSATNAWAVGTGSGAKTLILRWNGTSWTQVASPSPGSGGSLARVAATSASNAWAVGTAGGKALILRWNGTAWKQVPSPSPAGGAALAGVAATSATNAWAVGSSGTGTTLIERWNGKTWMQVPSPTPSRGRLFGVAATSASSAWAVGMTRPSSGPGKTLILRWNGTAWTRIPSPSPGADGSLNDVAATSARNAWAVGVSAATRNATGVIEHWDGNSWTCISATGTAGPCPAG